MRYLSAAMVLWCASGAYAQCVEEELTQSPYCFTPDQAAYFCETNGSTDAGLDQLVSCLDSSIRARGRLMDDDRDGCLGGSIQSEGTVQTVAGCDAR